MFVFLAILHAKLLTVDYRFFFSCVRNDALRLFKLGATALGRLGLGKESVSCICMCALVHLVLHWYTINSVNSLIYHVLIEYF